MSSVTSHTPRYVHCVRKSYFQDLPDPERIDLDEFCRLIGAHQIPRKAKNSRKKRRSRLLGSMTEFLKRANTLAQKMSPQKICFLSDSEECAADHQNFTKYKPGIIAYDFSHYKALEQEGLEKNPRLDWSFVEMAIEFHSSGGSFDDRRQRAHSYAAHLLADRPDLDSTLSILVEDRCMIIFICNPSGTKEVNVKESDCPSVLAAVVKYLNEGQINTCAGDIDRTIFTDNRPAFTLHTSKGTFKECELDIVGNPFGRRTNIFVTNETNGGSVHVIKEQTMKRRKHWKEKIILNKIHQHGAYPGIVRAGFFDRHPTSAGRSKARIGLLDKGMGFMDIDTPRKVLYALYDLLEVCRGLFRDRGILHRDISTGNVLWNESDSGTIPAEDTAPVPTVFISHLLDPSEPKHKSSVVLIDFDHAEMYTSRKRVMEAVGTPFFMARAIHKEGPLSQPGTYPPSPVLQGNAASVYKRSYPGRFKIFGNEMKTPTKVDDQAILPAFKHELRHDAESSVWVFFWWIIHAAPQGKESTRISSIVWRLISSDDPADGYRNRLLRSLQFSDYWEDFVDPEYRQLMPLVKSMAALIKEDYHWVKEEKYKHPEYLLDALQRIILNFVFENKEASFMDLQKSTECRQVEQNFIAPPQMYRWSPSLLFFRLASTRGQKRKATGSGMQGTQLLSAGSSSNRSGHDKLMAEGGNVSVMSERSGDIDGDRIFKKRRVDRIPPPGL